MHLRVELIHISLLFSFQYVRTTTSSEKTSTDRTTIKKSDKPIIQTTTSTTVTTTTITTVPHMIFVTNKRAPNYRVISVDLSKPAKQNWKTLVSEDKKNVLYLAYCAGKDKLVLRYVVDVKVFNLVGRINQIEMF